MSQFGVDNDKKIVSPTKLAIYSKTSNPPVDLLVSLVQIEPINEALRHALSYDFLEKYEQMQQAANDSLTRQMTPDFYFDGHLDALEVESIVAGDTALTAIVDATGQLVVHSGPKPLKN